MKYKFSTKKRIAFYDLILPSPNNSRSGAHHTPASHFQYLPGWFHMALPQDSHTPRGTWNSLLFPNLVAFLWILLPSAAQHLTVTDVRTSQDRISSPSLVAMPKQLPSLQIHDHPFFHFLISIPTSIILLAPASLCLEHCNSIEMICLLLAICMYNTCLFHMNHLHSQNLPTIPSSCWIKMKLLSPACKAFPQPGHILSYVFLLLSSKVIIFSKKKIFFSFEAYVNISIFPYAWGRAERGGGVRC